MWQSTLHVTSFMTSSAAVQVAVEVGDNPLILTKLLLVLLLDEYCCSCVVTPFKKFCGRSLAEQKAGYAMNKLPDWCPTYVGILLENVQI